MKVRLWRYEMTVTLRKRLSKAEREAIRRRLVKHHFWTPEPFEGEERVSGLMALDAAIRAESCSFGFPGCMCRMTEAEQRVHLHD